MDQFFEARLQFVQEIFEHSALLPTTKVVCSEQDRGESTGTSYIFDKTL